MFDFHPRGLGNHPTAGRLPPPLYRSFSLSQVQMNRCGRMRTPEHTGTTMNAGRGVMYAGTAEQRVPLVSPRPHLHIQSHTIYKDHKSNENSTKSEMDPESEPPQ